MTVHTIPVKLIVPPGKPPYLHVDIRNSTIRITKDRRPQTIEWSLQHHGAPGHFNALNDAISPGFLWISPPFPGIFGPPRLGHRDQTLALLDDHDLEEKIGTWYYRLSATIGGVVYRTRFESPFPPRVSALRSSRMTSDTTSSPTVSKPLLVVGYEPRGAGNPTIKNR
ncbi:hypothetical protein [Dyella sp. EPa41]|uniref:hypothetical protein n=1 Tax=Dyella sp. EPa41 TaxID=1561194 RepID=UPI001915A0FC|nr:hypothetical protein [Dyella sp. EPa41]